jgi:hypothetical protein
LTRALDAGFDSRLAENRQDARSNRTSAQEEGAGLSRRQVDTRPPSSATYPIQGFPFQLERTYQYRYPPFSQQLSQSFFPGGDFINQRQLLNGPRFFQQQLNARDLEPLRPETAKPRDTDADVPIDEAKVSGPSPVFPNNLHA